MTCASHNHKLFKTKITNEWKCRGKIFNDGTKECKGGEKTFKYRYSCTNTKCKDNSIDYCVECAGNKDTMFKHPKHNCKLESGIKNSGWACNAKSFKDGCLSGFSEFYKSNGENSFSCRPCDFDMCEKCYVHYFDGL